jgi:hypothetical protein
MVNESQTSSTSLSEGDPARLDEPPQRPAAGPPRPEAGAGAMRWTAGRIAVFVIGALMILGSLGLIGGGGVALWADLGHRDAAGYVTTDVHSLSTAGSALATAPVELGDPGVGWLYSKVVLGEVRIRVAPLGSGSSQLFVAVGPSADVDRYLAGVSQTVISDFWTDRLQATGGGTPGSAPGTQDFWVASATGAGAQTLMWEPANGSWTVVVMNADGQAGVDVTADLGATMPAMLGIAIGSLAVGGLVLICGVLLIVGAIRWSRPRGARIV